MSDMERHPYLRSRSRSTYFLGTSRLLAAQSPGGKQSGTRECGVFFFLKENKKTRNSSISEGKSEFNSNVINSRKIKGQIYDYFIQLSHTCLFFSPHSCLFSHSLCTVIMEYWPLGLNSEHFLFVPTPPPQILETA